MCFSETPSYNREFGTQRNSNPLEPPLSPTFTISPFTNYGDQFMYNLDQNGFCLPCKSGLQDPVPVASGSPSLNGTNSSLDHTDKCNTASSNNLSSNDRNDQWGDPLGYKNSYRNLDSRTEVVPLAFEDYEDDFSRLMHVILDYEAFWIKPPFRNHCLLPPVTLTWGGKSIISKSGTLKKFLSYGESERLVLQSLGLCIKRLLGLEGSGWLFSQNGECDDGLIDHVAATERLLHKDGPCEVNEAQRNKEGDLTIFLSTMPCCKEGCIWQASLVVSFGVWCVRRILELLLVESGTELWGNCICVLNCLQGILGPALTKPREPIFPCKCLQLPKALRQTKDSRGGAQFTSRSSILELIQDVEVSISGCKGWTSNEAYNIAFPKGRENLASFFTHYKHLLSKSSSRGDPSSQTPYDHSNCFVRCEAQYN